ncbi:MAG TPA: hypothetical protein VFV50_19290, partial [Bdellovibrionales bacterium]|nr:hypothetical protein [Bdellovibrionales bacterium]
MKFTIEGRHIENARNASRAASFFAAFIGLCVLSAWLFDLPWARQVVPGSPAMVPNTAVGITLAGALLAFGLGRLRHPSVAMLAVSVVLSMLGLAAVLESLAPSYPLTINHALAEFFLARGSVLEAGQDPFPHVTTGLSFCLLAIALGSLRRHPG